MNRKKILENRWVTMLEDEFQLPNGADVTYYHVQRADAVMSIVLNTAGDATETYVVKQYRHPISSAIWQFPLGGVTEGESDYCKSAQKELKEETGIFATEFEHVGSFYADPGFSSQMLHVCISETIESIGAQQLERSEYGLTFKKIKLGSVSTRIEAGEMGDAWGIAGLHYIHRFLGK